MKARLRDRRSSLAMQSLALWRRQAARAFWSSGRALRLPLSTSVCSATRNHVTKGLGKTIRAMADGTLDSQVGARICNGLGIMRACLETQKLEQLEARMDEIADRVARDRTNAAHKEIHP